MDKRTIYKDLVFELLHANPALADEPQVLADSVGCHINTARRWIEGWECTRHINWVAGPVCETRQCERCKRRADCESLGVGPVLCEKVTDQDVILAEIRGELEVLVESRPEELWLV